MSLEEQEDIDGLVAVADEVRKENIGDDVHILGLIEFSNYCKCLCNYCGLRMENARIDRYRMSEDEILEVAKGLQDKGIMTAVLQSGEDPLLYTRDNRINNQVNKSSY